MQTSYYSKNYVLIVINVTCGIGPSVNTLKVQLNFLSKLNFCNLFEFIATKSIENQHFPHLSSKNCEINLIR